MRWQAFANTVASFCQYGGKTLPIRWHNFANVVAQLCQCGGKMADVLRA
ncbi:hypothetical protein [Bacteroides intestinalis]|nr:hypothetical protein [Bacteroides intestinalis]